MSLCATRVAEAQASAVLLNLQLSCLFHPQLRQTPRKAGLFFSHFDSVLYHVNGGVWMAGWVLSECRH